MYSFQNNYINVKITISKNQHFRNYFKEKAKVFINYLTIKMNCDLVLAAMALAINSLCSKVPKNNVE